VGDVLAGARPWWVLGVVGVSLLTIYIRAQRWRVLLRPVGETPLYPALSATAIGFGASAVLPFRIGELVRPALLARSTGIAMSAALSSVVLERLFDMLLVISCFLAVSIVYPEVPDWLRRGAYVLAPLVVVGFGVLVAMQRNRPAAERLVEGILGLLPGRLAAKLRPVATSFLAGLEALADLRTVALVLGYSIYLWGVITLTFLLSFLALDIDIPLVAGSLTTVVVVAAAVFLPQAPGFVGTWQAGCVVALSLFKVSQEAAVGYSLLTWIVQMAVNISAAGFFLAREQTSIGQLVRAAETAPAEVDG
jgi:glycosyltransferase 2 family protein